MCISRQGLHSSTGLCKDIGLTGEVLCKHTCFDKAVPSEQALPHLEQLDRVPRPYEILIFVCHVPWRLCKEGHYAVGCHTQDICTLSISLEAVR